MNVEKFGRVFFDWTETPSLLVDAGGVIRLANPAFEEMAGTNPVKSASFASFLSESGKVAFRKFLNAFILAGAEPESDRFRDVFASDQPNSGQEWEWRFAQYQHFYLVQGKLCGSDDRAAFFERHSTTAIAVVKEGKLSDVNDRFLQLFGYRSRKDVVGMLMTDFPSAEYRNKFEEGFGKADLDFTASMQKRDGSRFVANVRIEQTNIEEVPATIMMLDAQQSTTKTLMESGLLFGAMFDKAASGIALVNRDGEILEINRAVCEMLGYTREEVPGKKAIDFIYRKDRKLYREGIGLVANKTVTGFRRVIRIRKSNNRLLHTDLSVEMIQVAGGASYYLATLIDVDKRIKAEKNLTLRAKELARSNEDLENFAIIASHDLKEPLRTISSFAQLLERRYKGKLEGDADLYIDYVVSGTKRMKELIQDLLEYASVKKQDRELESVNLNELLDEVNINLQEVTEDSEANILNEFLPTVRCNKTQMLQLFQNLIENAIKFKGEEEPEVVVTVEDKKDRYLFSVKDNGIGIEPQFGNKIFTLFQRLNERQQYDGNGIGLAVCKKIVENHGGKIWVDPQVDRGSVFHFTLKK